MNHRFLESMGVMAIATGLMGILLASAPVAAQTQKAATAPAKKAAAGKPWTVAKTPDGQPDLQDGVHVAYPPLGILGGGTLLHRRK